MARCGRSLRGKWAVDPDRITASPMYKMEPPRIPEAPPDVLTDDQLRRLVTVPPDETLRVAAQRMS
jgi:site-specific recombinase XerC